MLHNVGQECSILLLDVPYKYRMATALHLGLWNKSTEEMINIAEISLIERKGSRSKRIGTVTTIWLNIRFALLIQRFAVFLSLATRLVLLCS